MKASFKLKLFANLVFLLVWALNLKTQLFFESDITSQNIPDSVVDERKSFETPKADLNKEHDSSQKNVSKIVNFVENSAEIFAAADDLSFVKLFCKYKLLPVPTKPTVCIYNPNVDQYISGRIVEGQIWDQTGK